MLTIDTKAKGLFGSCRGNSFNNPAVTYEVGYLSMQQEYLDATLGRWRSYEEDEIQNTIFDDITDADNITKGIVVFLPLAPLPSDVINGIEIVDRGSLTSSQEVIHTQ